MKRNIIAISMFLVLSSCTDFLELNPKTAISEDEYFKTENDIFQALTGVYDILQEGHSGPHYYFSLCADILSDDLNAGGGDATDIAILQVLDNYTMSSITSPSGLWSQYYKGINRANMILEKIDGASGDAETLARYRTEAYLLRDVFYYWLWIYYGNIIVLEKNVTNPSEYYTQTQLSASEVYEFLIRDLDENVLGKLPMSVSGEETGRLTDATALTLKAKIILFQNDQSRFPALIQDLRKIIDSGQYGLVSDYEMIWLQEGEHCRESIFEVNFSVDDGTRMPQLTFPRGFEDPTGVFVEGWGFGTLNKEVVDLYDATDIRKGASVFAIDDSIKAYETAERNWVYTPAHQNTGYFLKKYAPRVGYYGPQRFQLKNNIRVFRYSDVLLMAAEAMFRSGVDQSLAQTYFAEVWERARPTATTPTPALTLDLLYDERRREFVGEGHRYWDLIRTGQAASALGSKGWQSHHRYLPIPDSELSKAQGSLKQNDGYGNN